MSVLSKMIQKIQSFSSSESRNTNIWGIFITQDIPMYSYLLQLEIKPN